MIRLKYSKNLGDIASIVVIDGDVVKYRGCDLNYVQTDSIDKAILNHKNILIQNNEKIDIYCKQMEAQIYHNEIISLKNRGFSSYSLKNINLHCNGIIYNAENML